MIGLRKWANLTPHHHLVHSSNKSMSIVIFFILALKAMAAMDIFLLTSRLEGLPNVLIEAQAIGVPVVTTNVGGAPETMLDRVTGWVLDNDEIIDAANQIIRLIRDENWRDQARLSMPTFVREKFGMEKMLNKTLSIYGVQ